MEPTNTSTYREHNTVLLVLITFCRYDLIVHGIGRVQGTPPITSNNISNHSSHKAFEKLNFVWTANRDPATCAHIVVIYQSGGI